MVGKGLDGDYIVRLYKAGLSADRIAKRLGCDHNSVLYHLKKRDVPRRSDRAPLDVDEIVRLYVDEQLSEQEIAIRMNVSREPIKRRLNERGIKRRNPSEAMYLRLSRMTLEERQALAAKANEAARGRKDTPQALASKAVAREANLMYVGYGER